MRKVFGFIALTVLAFQAVPVTAQTVPVQTIYEDMRLICGTERSTDYKVRIIQRTARLKREFRKQGVATLVVRLNANDAAPEGLSFRTRADCLN